MTSHNAARATGTNARDDSVWLVIVTLVIQSKADSELSSHKPYDITTLRVDVSI